MKVFEIINEENIKAGALVYLIYYEKTKRFFAEIPEDADPWEIPIVFSCLLQNGTLTANSYWCEKWVRERIVPTDRQNIGQILRDNELDEYDEFKLLEISEGRCAQDQYFLKRVNDSKVLSKFRDRYSKRVSDVIILPDFEVLVSLEDETLIKLDIKNIAKEKEQFKRILQYSEMFEKIEIQPGGHGICWGNNFEISKEEIREKGDKIPITMDAFRSFARNNLISTAEAASELDCSRQNIACLVGSGSLHIIKEDPKNKYFLKSDIIKRTWY